MEDWEGPSEMAQGLYSSKFSTGSIDGGITISLRNFIGEGIIKHSLHNYNV
jgi:hypothetical protein